MNKPAFTVHMEDEQILIVEKPAAMHTAPLHPADQANLLSQVIAHYPEIAHLPGLKNIEPGLLHRLDYETSGLVLIARTETAFIRLSAQFKQNQVTKNYYAVSLFREGQLTGSPIGFSLADWHRLCQAWTAPMVPAAPSIFKVESHFRPWGQGRKQVKVITEEKEIQQAAEVTPASYTSEIHLLKHQADNFLSRVTLTKGFRHQVRAHLAYLGLPIAGDPLYLKPLAEHQHPVSYARMYLHAAGLKFRHPTTGKLIDYQTPVPQDFEDLLKPEKRE